jgi:dihydroorotate dehydrogenase (fumarate)
MDLTTRYLGLTLAHPFMAGASPLSSTLDGVKRLEDAGAAAIVLPSIFEEQITLQSRGEIHHRDVHDATVAQYPAADEYLLTPDAYLEHIRRSKQSVRIPVIGSLNGTTQEVWLLFASTMEQAGVDALELNLYDVVSDPNRSAMSVEAELRDIVSEMKRALRIPIAVKLSPFYTALGNLARRLDDAGVDGLVLFNRFWQPDVDLTTLTITPRLDLSRDVELTLRLQWAALLFGRIRASLAIGGGVDSPEDGMKALLAGASAVQQVSALLRHGLGHLETMRAGLHRFLEQHAVNRLCDMIGKVSFSTMEDPAAFQRAAYIRTLQLK